MFKKVLSIIIAGAMCLGMCTIVGAQNILNTSATKNLTASQAISLYTVPKGETLVYCKIIEQTSPNDFVIETLTKKNDVSTRSASGSITHTKTDSTYYNGVLQGTASLTASFTYNENNNYVDITSDSYYFSSNTLYTNPSVSYNYSGYFTYKGTVKLSYRYNAFTPSNKSISITCDCKGNIS